MMLRMFLPVVPGAAGDIPFAYLTALRQLSIPTRALPIGAAVAMGIEKRWYDISSSFTVPMSIPFVNIVCAPAGYQMGSKVPLQKALASDEGVPAELRALVGTQSRKAKSSDGDVVYEPATAFAGLWTKGCKNIAIVCGTNIAEGVELVALEQYDLIIINREHPWSGHAHCDHEGKRGIASCNAAMLYRDADGASWDLREYHGSMRYVPPDANELARALGEACGFAISVTTPPSAATPEQPATTLQPSTGSTTSSSRSPASRKVVIPPKRATATSTSTPDRSDTGSTDPLFSRMWRSITRSLGFSKR